MTEGSVLQSNFDFHWVCPKAWRDKNKAPPVWAALEHPLRGAGPHQPSPEPGERARLAEKATARLVPCLALTSNPMIQFLANLWNGFLLSSDCEIERSLPWRNKKTAKTVAKRPAKSASKRKPSPAQLAVREAGAITGRIIGDLQNVRNAFLRIGRLLTEVRDRKHYVPLHYETMEDYAEKRLKRSRRSIAEGQVPSMYRCWAVTCNYHRMLGI